MRKISQFRTMEWTMGCLILTLGLFLPSIVLAQSSGESLLEKCICPPARCDECHTQQGINFFTPRCKDGTLLSCAQAKCVDKDPLPQRCEEERRRAAAAKKSSVETKQKAVTLKDNDYGVFVVTSGDVRIKKRDGVTEPAMIGKKVFPGDMIMTGDNSKARLMFTDNNVISLAPATQLEIQTYEFDEKTNKKVTVLSLGSGQVRNSLNQKYDGVKNRFQVKTPTAVAGVRGTDFIVNYDKNVEDTKIVTFHGEVEFGKSLSANNSIIDSIPVPAGMSSDLASDMIKPMPAKSLTSFEIARLDAESQVLPSTDSGVAPGPSMAPPNNAEPAAPHRSSDGRRPAGMVEATCFAPSAALYECTWVQSNGQCQRRRCFADGTWKMEAIERSTDFCFEGEVKACD